MEANTCEKLDWYTWESWNYLVHLDMLFLLILYPYHSISLLFSLSMCPALLLALQICCLVRGGDRLATLFLFEEFTHTVAIDCQSDCVLVPIGVFCK